MLRPLRILLFLSAGLTASVPFPANAQEQEVQINGSATMGIFMYDPGDYVSFDFNPMYAGNRDAQVGRSVARFDISSIPAGARVTSVVAHIYYSKRDAGNATVSINRMSGPIASAPPFVQGMYDDAGDEPLATFVSSPTVAVVSPGAIDLGAQAAEDMTDGLAGGMYAIAFSADGQSLTDMQGSSTYLVVTYLERTSDADGDGVEDDLDLCPRTVIPESVPTVSLEAGRYALVDRNLRFDTMKSGVLSPGPRRFKTTETGGCSCAQIVKRTGAGAKNLKYGCTRSLISDWIATVPTLRTRAGEPTDLALSAFEDGTDEFTTSDLPTEFALEGNYPNPFNPVTTIRFDMPEAAPVRLSVFDVMGREVRVLVQGTLEAGRHEASFDGAGLPSGTYLYRLTTPTGVFSKTMVLLK